MKIIIKPSEFNGEIWANPSKSIMQRAVALSALSGEEVFISNPDYSADSLASIGIAENMGATVTKDDDFIVITPGNELKNTVWDVGEAGLSARMFAPIAGLYEEDITITGKGSILKRPMNSVIEALEQLGLEVEHNNFCLPLKIKGKINNYNLDLDLSSGSQLLTGLLIALSKADKDSKIRVKNLKSKPYIDLTICAAQGFGAEIINEDYKHFSIKGNRDFKRKKFNIEGDWSGVAFHLVGAAISGKATITGINPRSKQADRAVLDVLEQAGAKIKIKHNKITVERAELKAFEFDATDCPDLFPPVAVLAAYCKGTSKIKGISRLKHKESNRFLTLQEEFGKLGVKITAEGDFMVIEGKIPSGGSVFSHNDHRIAMAMATAGLRAKGDIEIQNAECINKSYPDYFLDYEILGGLVIE